MASYSDCVSCCGDTWVLFLGDMLFHKTRSILLTWCFNSVQAVLANQSTYTQISVRCLLEGSDHRARCRESTLFLNLGSCLTFAWQGWKSLVAFVWYRIIKKHLLCKAVFLCLITVCVSLWYENIRRRRGFHTCARTCSLLVRFFSGPLVNFQAKKIVWIFRWFLVLM